MAPKKVQKQGTKVLCEALKLMHDLNVQIVNDASNSVEERRAAHISSVRAKRDAQGWGCAWAKRR